MHCSSVLLERANCPEESFFLAFIFFSHSLVSQGKDPPLADCPHDFFYAVLRYGIPGHESFTGREPFRVFQ